MPILKQTIYDEQEEIQFELDFHASLTLAQRFKMLEERKKRFMEQLIQHGHRKSAEVIKRT